MTTEPSIGWLGTGKMGSVMAGRLIDAGRPVTVWNRTTSKTAPLAARGAQVAPDITALAGCGLVFTMVTGPADLEEVTLGEGGLLAGEPRPGVLVDCSTVSEAASARIRAAAAAAGVGFLAAPVTGNPEVFAEGQGSFIVSGPVDTFEAVPLAEKAGTSREAFLEFFNGSGLTSPWIRRRSPELITGDRRLTFTSEQLRKDFDLGLAAARALEVPMPSTSTVYQIIQLAIGNGLREEDFLSLYELQARGAGLG